MVFSWRIGMLAMLLTGVPWLAFGDETKPPAEGPEAEFHRLCKDFLDTYLTQYPVTATRLGDHRHDVKWSDNSEEARQWRAAWLRQTRGRLESIPLNALPPEDQVDAAILAHRLDASLFSMEHLRPWENRPLSVVGEVGSGLDYLVSRDFAPLPIRMLALKGRLDALPGFLARGQAALVAPPRIHTETAIDQNKGLIAFVNGSMRADFDQVPEQAEGLNASADAAAAALEEFQRFLEDELLPRSTDEFRMGSELFEQKLQYTLDTGLTADDVVQRAWTTLEQTRANMVVLARELHPEFFPGEPVPHTPDEAAETALIRKVLDHMAADHADDATVFDQARASLEEATRFVEEHDLVTLPGDPVEVIEMPEFNRGVSIAYCDSPGPFEENPQTFYAIAPPPEDWSDERRESFYREYNSTMIKDLTVHEAMPGHYLQLAHAARFKSPIRAVFGSGTFVEGWALYSEWVMEQHGFGGPAVAMQRHKMVLRLCINAIIDNGVQAGSMTHDEAVALMTGKGFQEEGEAEGKWTRACLTSTQLSTYLIGLLEMMDIRRDYEARSGEEFDLKAYNDEILAHGSPAPRHLRMLLGLEGE